MSEQAKQGRDTFVRGRIVWTSAEKGDVFKGRPQTDKNTKAPRVDKNGKQIISYGFGLAVPKMLDGQPNQELARFEAMMMDEARTIYPSGIPPKFTFKFKDGDTDIDENGKPYRERDGYPGHKVFALTSMIPVKFFKFETSIGKNVMIESGIKCGDYVNVQVNLRAHGPLNGGAPGMYLNPNAAQLIGYGTLIESRTYQVDGDSLFGAQAPGSFQGASQMPPAQPMGGFPDAQPMQQPQGYQPHTGILPGHMQQAPVQQFGQPMGQQFPFNGGQSPMGSGFNPGQPAYQSNPSQPAAYPSGMNVGNGLTGSTPGHVHHAPQQNMSGFPGQVAQPTANNAFPFNGQQQPQGFGQPFPGAQR